MAQEEYRKALKAIGDELHKLLAQREQLDKRIAQLRQSFSTFTMLCDKEEVEVFEDQARETKIKPEVGLIEACREVLKATGQYMTARQVRDGLIEYGFNIGKYRNPLAVIHTTLKRLYEAEEVLKLDEPKQQTMYGWIGYRKEQE